MEKFKKLMAVAMASLMAAASMTACSSSKSASSAAEKSAESGSEASSGSTVKEGEEIYFLNFKPEIADQYKAIAEDYEKETGIKVNVQTAASGTYEATLKSEIAKADPPTIFQINGPIGYSNWKDYCADLKETKLYSYLTDQSLAVTDGDGVYGIPYSMEGYGLIYNNAIMQKYFALSDKGTSFSSVDDIDNFEKLKSVAEDMTKHKDELGIKGVFASTSLTPGEDWRWQTHLLNIPMYYEFKDEDMDANTVTTGVAANEIKFTYAKNFKNIFDLYLNNSTTAKTLLGSKSVDDSMSEFALGQCAMVQNGEWAWSQISKVEGNVVKESDIKMMPIYTGVDGEEKNGICVGTENYFAINKKVSASKQQASADFLNWLFSSEKGKDYVLNKLGFIAPFNTFSDSERPSDPLSKEVLNWMAKDGKTSIPWTFECFPSQNFKDAVGAALLEYAQGGKDWNNVQNTVITTWKSEKAASAAS